MKINVSLEPRVKNSPHSGGFFIDIENEYYGHEFKQFLIENKEKLILFVSGDRLGYRNSDFYIPMKITEENYKICDNYKVAFESIFGQKVSFYMSDLNSLLSEKSETVQFFILY